MRVEYEIGQSFRRHPQGDANAIGIQFTEDELARVQSAATALGMSLDEFVLMAFRKGLEICKAERDGEPKA